MKKLVCLLIFLTIGISLFAEAESDTSDRAIRNYRQSLRYMFIGQTIVAEAVFPVLATTGVNVLLADEIVNSRQKMTAAVVIDSLFIVPVIAGVYIYMNNKTNDESMN